MRPIKPSELKTELIERILSEPLIEFKKSKFSTAPAFFVGKKEIAHFHGNDELDIRVTKPVIKREKFLVAGDKRVRQERQNSDWLQFKFKGEKDLQAAYDLVLKAATAEGNRRP
jgi:hypothetical protein